MTDIVGFIGLGIMGMPMASNLLQNGYQVIGYARNREAINSFIELGGEVLKTPEEVGKNCNILITIVSDTPDVQEVLFEKNGAFHGLSSGDLVIDMSTISPHASKQFAEKLERKGIGMLDAPVSGGEVGAIAGSLSIMIGGDDKDVARAMPLFNCMGKTITHIGEKGAGQVAKACNQLLIAQIINGVSEALLFAHMSGVNIESVRKALSGGMAGCKVLDVHALRMIEDNYSPGFKSKLHLKDMNIVDSEIKRLGLQFEGASLGLQRLVDIVEHGNGELDSSIMYSLLKKRNKPID